MGLSEAVRVNHQEVDQATKQKTRRDLQKIIDGGATIEYDEGSRGGDGGGGREARWTWRE